MQRSILWRLFTCTAIMLLIYLLTRNLHVKPSLTDNVKSMNTSLDDAISSVESVEFLKKSVRENFTQS